MENSSIQRSSSLQNKEAKPRHAIVSVSDKSGLPEFCHALQKHGIVIFASDGTASFLEKHGIAAKRIESLTGMEEMMQGRVKTLHPRVHGGILLRRKHKIDERDAQKNAILPIDIVVVNLYPFAKTLVQTNRNGKASVDNKPSAAVSETHEKLLDNIDIGGVALLRAAAKNHRDVTVLCDPADYNTVAKKLNDTGSLQGDGIDKQRLQLAQKAFHHTAVYDSTIAAYFSNQVATQPINYFHTTCKQPLRYGENPHETGELHSVHWVNDPNTFGNDRSTSWSLGFANARVLHGKQMSYNNYLDSWAAMSTVADFLEPTVAIVKHLNPCGLASSKEIHLSLKWAMQGDTVSSYGSIVAFNRPFTPKCIEVLGKLFVEIIIAPKFEGNALQLLTQKSKNIRILEVESVQTNDQTNLDKQLSSSMQIIGDRMLIKKSTTNAIGRELWKTPTIKKAEDDQLPLYEFALRSAKHVKSNAIAIACHNSDDHSPMLLGMGAGQPNRLDSLRLAIAKARENIDRMHAGKSNDEILAQCVLASDAFFPFADNIELAAKHGIRKYIQPGGSIRDDAVVAAADRHEATMIICGRRFFKH